jgi:hypothetical protein
MEAFRNGNQWHITQVVKPQSFLAAQFMLLWKSSNERFHKNRFNRQRFIGNRQDDYAGIEFASADQLKLLHRENASQRQFPQLRRNRPET